MEVVVHQYISNDILKTSVVSLETGEIYGQDVFVRHSFYFVDVAEAALDDAVKFAEGAGYNIKTIDSPFKAMKEGGVDGSA
ncbi:hypothetical protein [Metabacillus sp. Hm71]|uniref:hypothetical protein n=1 Tax=Metabacillus sp. Hm71 TaxID=3450743 RepID=UPI003F43678E